MGVRIAVVIMSTSFLLGMPSKHSFIQKLTQFVGVLMTHWIADSLTLWKSPLTDAHLYTAAAYYSLLAKMNVGMAAAAVAVVTIGFMGLLLSAQDGEAGNLMFDGASMCSFLLSIYFSSSLLTNQCSSSLWKCCRRLRILCSSKTRQVFKSHTLCRQSTPVSSGSASAHCRTRFFAPHLCSSSYRCPDPSSGEILGRRRRR
jgi:ER membrane protein SH3